MLKVDLHCHTKYSDHPAEWFLKRIGTAESYTEPEFLYKKMNEEEMDFVCVTDHNTIGGCLELMQKYPEKVIMGVESTTYFPEDSCKVHILLFDITEKQFEDVEKLRNNIYDLREYIVKNRIAYSVAHATFSVNSRLTFENVEKLTALFDVFEARNGTQSKFVNTQWENILKCFKLSDLERVCSKHNIAPISPTSWIKGFTAGSDDHAGLFLGKTYTTAMGTTKQDFINAIRNKETSIEGRHNDFESLAFSYYKVAYDFSKTKRDPSSASLVKKISTALFNSKNKFKKPSIENFRDLLIQFADELGKINPNEIGDNVDDIFNTTANLSDEFLKHIISSVREKMEKGDIIGLIEKISSAMPSFFIIAPFFTSVKHISQDRELLDKLNANFSGNRTSIYKKILWFTDTLVDLNGVAETLKEIGWRAHESGYNITIATCIPQNQKDYFNVPPNVINLPLLTSFTLPYYEKMDLRVPSVLKSLKFIKDIDPDEIYISSPGPIGIFGLIASKFFGVPSCGVYHTDFAAQAKQISDDNGLYEITDSFMKWFYNHCSKIKVSTKYYADVMTSRGYKKSEFLPKGIDTDKFCYKSDSRGSICKMYNIEDGVNLLYAGRVSADKNIDFLISVFESVKKEHDNVNLIIAGDGPILERLKDEHKHNRNIIFTGRVERLQLVDIYSASDLFVFPSVTDTFGMVVLEAQACSLPAVVSDVGGPQEVIVNGETGVTLAHGNHQKWVTEISKIIDICKKYPSEYSLIRQKSRKNAVERFNWDNVLKSIVEKTDYASIENFISNVVNEKTEETKKIKELAV